MFFLNWYFENVNRIISFTITVNMFVFLIMKRIVNTLLNQRIPNNICPCLSTPLNIHYNKSSTCPNGEKVPPVQPIRLHKSATSQKYFKFKKMLTYLSPLLR